jgi:hypothetical protein
MGSVIGVSLFVAALVIVQFGVLWGLVALAVALVLSMLLFIDVYVR